MVYPNTGEIPSIFAAQAGFPIFAVRLSFYPQGTEVKNTSQGDQIDIAPNIP